MVKRYDLWTFYDDWQEDESDDGGWVKYEDHAAELATLRAELAEWKVYGKDKAEQLVREQVAHMAERELSDRLAEAIKNTSFDYENWSQAGAIMVDLALEEHAARRAK